MRLLKLLLLASSISGCSSAKPEINVFEALPKGRETPIFVTAARQKDEVKKALRDAGFHIIDRMEESERLMRVTIGVDQGEEACGTLNNVRFQLRFEGRNVAEASAKGWTGSCQPNILEELSRDMWRRLFGVSGN